MLLSKKILLLSFLPLLLVPVYAQEATTDIPVWVKGVANFWVEGNISDDEFGEAITFLIEQRIFKIDSVDIPEQTFLSDDQKRLYDLEISNLEDEVKEVGLDNSHMLIRIVEMKDTQSQCNAEVNRLNDVLRENGLIGIPTAKESENRDFDNLMREYNELEERYLIAISQSNCSNLAHENENLKSEIEDLEDDLVQQVKDGDLINQALEKEIQGLTDGIFEKNKIIIELQEEIENLK